MKSRKIKYFLAECWGLIKSSYAIYLHKKGYDSMM